MNRNMIRAALLSLVALNVFSMGVFAQNNPPQTTKVVAPAQAKSGGKLSFRLDALAQSSMLRAASVADQALALGLPAQGAGSLMRDAQGRILVDIRMSDLTDPQVQALRNTGAQIVNISDRYRNVTALVDMTALTSIANLPATESVQEELTPVVNDAVMPLIATGHRPSQTGMKVPNACPQGAAVSEGDTQLNAASARSTYGIDGTGVKVGILSDSYDQYASAVTHASTDVSTGDLPGVGNPCGQLTPVNVITTSLITGVSDEGRAMLQIVHDLAPGASPLSFASAFNGIYQFGDSIRNLRAAGADIIADDIFYYVDPFFQEGPVSVAISDVVGSGALYFGLAGNHNIIIGGNNVSSYEALSYRPAACPIVLSGDCHDFDPGGGINTTSAITISYGGWLYLDFQYNEPWYGVTDDFDVFLLNDANSIVAQSYYDNLTTQTPFEFFTYRNLSGSTQRYRIVINRYSGTGTPRIKYILTQGTSGVQAVQYNTSSGGDIVGPTVYGHSASLFGFNVAAVPYNSMTTPETYTSRGPAAHYYGPVVNTLPAAAITPMTLQKPDFAATDGGCTTFFGGFSSGCYRFYGTSAATPHAAAVTALLKQKANLMGISLSRGLAQSVLTSTARSMSGGNVNSVGAGLIDALGAVQKLVNTKLLFLPLIKR